MPSPPVTMLHYLTHHLTMESIVDAVFVLTVGSFLPNDMPNEQWG